MDPGVVKAFQDLTYEDETPLSLGEHFKQLGNDRFKRGKNNAMYFRHAQQVCMYAQRKMCLVVVYFVIVDVVGVVMPLVVPVVWCL